MKATSVIWIVLTTAVAALGDKQQAVSPELKSLHGTMVTMISADEGLSCEIWAKGDKTRTERTISGRKIITIQLGDTLYTYSVDSAQGHRTRFETGLASMGLIKQIAEIRSKGQLQGSQKFEGSAYDKFLYRAPGERATVYLAPKTSLPRLWESAVETGEKKVSSLTMHFRNMEVNPNIPDEKFTLPRGVKFSEVPNAELIATAQVVGEQLAAAWQLKSLHGTMLVRVSDDKDQRFEIWAKNKNVRAEHTANGVKIINIQLGDMLYTYPQGSTTGKKRRMAPGLRSRGLIEQIELIKLKGTKEGSQEVEGIMYDKYRYDLDAPAEKAIIYLATKTFIPGVWISRVNRPYEGPEGVLVMQYRDIKANVKISDDLFALPRGVTFAEVPSAAKAE